VLRKDDNEWVKKCVDYKDESVPTGRPKITWKKIVEVDIQERKEKNTV